MNQLREQLYTTSRAYYIGTKHTKIISKLPLSTEFTKIPMIWLTPNKYRAMEFCFGDDNPGVLYKVKLNKYLHVFNARSQEDISKLRDFIDLTEDQLFRLQNSDFYFWLSGRSSHFDTDSDNRNMIIDFIEQIKYGSNNQFDCDGLLNFEKHPSDHQSSNKNPGLGLFNDKFIIRDAIEYKDWKYEWDGYNESLRMLKMSESEFNNYQKTYYGINCQKGIDQS